MHTHQASSTLPCVSRSPSNVDWELTTHGSGHIESERKRRSLGTWDYLLLGSIANQRTNPKISGQQIAQPTVVADLVAYLVQPNSYFVNGMAISGLQNTQIILTYIKVKLSVSTVAGYTSRDVVAFSNRQGVVDHAQAGEICRSFTYISVYYLLWVLNVMSTSPSTFVNIRQAYG